MKAAVVAGLLAVVALGAYLVASERGTVAVGYAVGTAGIVVVLTLRQLDQSLSPAPLSARPLLRLRAPRRRSHVARPSALLEWEEALLAAVVHGWAARTIGRRLAPLVETLLRERREIEPDDPRVRELLGPTWSMIHPDTGCAGAGAPRVSLDDIDDVTHRLEAL
ncbi:MAG: hypothetical protein M3503_01100 [Actinomycetota bacterium]|nr:hypothetical protein [Actinomycetota bacterium]